MMLDLSVMAKLLFFLCKCQLMSQNGPFVLKWYKIQTKTFPQLGPLQAYFPPPAPTQLTMGKLFQTLQSCDSEIFKAMQRTENFHF